MLKLKKASAAFVLSLILGVSLFSTGAFAQSAHSIQNAQNANVSWCGGGWGGGCGGGWGGGWGGCWWNCFCPWMWDWCGCGCGGWGW